MKLLVRDIVEAANGTLLSGDMNTEIFDFCTDSRSIKEGDLFIPIIGEKVDAHRYIEDVMKKCAATLTSEHDSSDSEKAYIKVEDTSEALVDIGRMLRSRINIPVVGITGSVGKTTTRQMIAAALGKTKKTYETEKNYNSVVGLPLTLEHVADEEMAVLEMGTGGPGEMAKLSSMSIPDVGVITMIGVAHLEKFGTRDKLLAEKLAIANCMKPGSPLFVNGDDELLKKAGELLPNNKIFYYGTGDNCQYKAENIEFDYDEFVYKYDYVHEDKKVQVVLKQIGMHNVMNSLVALAICDYFGFDVEKSAKVFSDFEGMRQKIVKGACGVTIIDDAYNASPDSMKASLSVLNDIPSKGRRVAVLGDMKELGSSEVRFHEDIGSFICEKNIDTVFTVGDLAENIIKKIREIGADIRCQSFIDNAEIESFLSTEFNENDVVLFKASNSMKFSELVKEIM